MTERTKDELKKDKATRIIVMSNAAIEMLKDLIKDVEDWSSSDDITPANNMQHQMHQNETCANLIFLVEYLQNKQRRS